MRIVKRNCCSSSVIENQYLTRMMPERTSMRSNSGTRAEELLDIVLAAKAHHALDAGAVVPAPVEQHDLAAGRQMGDIALEIPLRALALARRRQRDDAADARVQPLRDALDHAALAGRVAAFEDHDDLQPVFDHPVLQLDQFALQPEQLAEIDPAVEHVGRWFVGRFIDKARQALFVELELEFLIETLGHLGPDPVGQRPRLAHLDALQEIDRRAKRPPPRSVQNKGFVFVTVPRQAATRKDAVALHLLRRDW